MKRCVVAFGLAVASVYVLAGEDIFSATNYWGGRRKEYRWKALAAAAQLSTNGNDNVIRDWYCSVPSLPIFDDGSAPLPWLEEKAFLLYYLSTVSPIRSSTNCWFAAADAWGSCRALLAQCEADFTRARGCSVATNTSFADIGLSKERFQMRWNRLVSVRRAEPLLADVVTNKFPSNISKVLPDDEMRTAQSQAYNRAGLQ